MLPLTVYTKNTPRYVHSEELKSAVKAKYPSRYKDIHGPFALVITTQVELIQLLIYSYFTFQIIN